MMWFFVVSIFCVCVGFNGNPVTFGPYATEYQANKMLEAVIAQETAKAEAREGANVTIIRSTPPMELVDQGAVWSVVQP